MKYIAGVDIGNSTTEVCIGEITLEGKVVFLSSASCPTTGTKGTVENTHAIKTALKAAMSKINKEISDISLIRLNEAAPVIGDTAMETLTETIITDSSMIGTIHLHLRGRDRQSARFSYLEKGRKRNRGSPIS